MTAPQLNQIDRLLELEENWDSYGGARIDFKAVEKAKAFAAFVKKNVDNFCYVPTSSGSIQVECHADGWDFEFDFGDEDFYFEKSIKG